MVVIVKLPDDHVFVRKGKKGRYHIASRNIHSHRPIHLAKCSFDVGEGQEWPDTATEADSDSVCVKCANSLWGFRWYEIERGMGDPSSRRG